MWGLVDKVHGTVIVGGCLNNLCYIRLNFNIKQTLKCASALSNIYTGPRPCCLRAIQTSFAPMVKQLNTWSVGWAVALCPPRPGVEPHRVQIKVLKLRSKQRITTRAFATWFKPTWTFNPFVESYHILHLGNVNKTLPTLFNICHESFHMWVFNPFSFFFEIY